MLLHYRDVVQQTVLSECLAIQAQSQRRLGAILKEKNYITQEHLMRGYQLVYQRFSICANCAESHDLQKGALPTCPHCGHNVWFKDNPAQIFAPAPAKTPSARLQQAASPPPTTKTFSAPVSTDPNDPFNMPIGYQQQENQGEFSKLIATSNLGKRPDLEKKLQESQEMDLGLSMDELDIFQIEQMEAAQKAAEATEKESPPAPKEKAPAPKAEAPKTAPKKEKPAPKAPSKKSDEMAVSAEFGDWKKVQALMNQGATVSADQPQAAPAPPPPNATPVKAEKKGCGKSAALFLLILGSLAIPVVAYAFS